MTAYATLAGRGAINMVNKIDKIDLTKNNALEKDGYMLLLQAISRQAIIDYAQALVDDNKDEQKKIEQFFEDSYINVLPDRTEAIPQQIKRKFNLRKGRLREGKCVLCNTKVKVRDLNKKWRYYCPNCTFCVLVDKDSEYSITYGREENKNGDSKTCRDEL